MELERLAQTLEIARIIISLLVIVILALGGSLMWFLKGDRKKFMEELKANKDYIKECKEEIDDRILKIEGEVDEIRINYNDKFKTTHEKIDAVKDAVNQGHTILLNAIHKVELKIK